MKKLLILCLLLLATTQAYADYEWVSESTKQLQEQQRQIDIQYNTQQQQSYNRQVSNYLNTQNFNKSQGINTYLAPPSAPYLKTIRY